MDHVECCNKDDCLELMPRLRERTAPSSTSDAHTTPFPANITGGYDNFISDHSQLRFTVLDTS